MAPYGTLSDAVDPSAVATRAVETLREAGAHPIVQSFPHGALVVFDRDLRFLSAGGLGLADVGLTRSMLEGHTIFEVFPPEVAATMEQRYLLALEGVESVIDVPYRDHIYLMRLGPIRDTEGEIVAGLGFTQDITESRRSEGQLRESEELARLAFDRAPTGNALIGVDGGFLQVNQAMCDITEYSATELCDLADDDIVHPDDVVADRAAACRLVAGGESSDVAADVRYVTQSGRTVWVSKSRTLWRDDTGAPLHFVAHLHDITQRKVSEIALVEERSRLHEAELIGRMGSWEMDVDTGDIRWSDALYELRGLDRDAFDGNWAAASVWIHPDDRGRLSDAITECGRSGEPMLVRYRVTRASDGALCWFDARGKAIYQGDRVVRVVGTAVDVTNDVLAAEKAATANAFQQAVITASPDLIFVYDLVARRTVWANRSISEALGYPGDGERVEASAVSSMNGSDVFTHLVFPDDRAKFATTLDAARFAVDDGVILLDHRMCHADGSTRWFSRRTTALRRDETGHVTQVVGVLRDRTARMKIERARAELEARLADAILVEQRAKLEAQLQQAQRLETVGQLAGGIAHDFNNLLAGITTYASLVSSGLQDLGSRGLGEDDVFSSLLQDVDEITAVANRAAALTQQLLIFSRREVVQPTVLDLNSLVADLGKLLARTIGERIDLATLLTDDVPHIRADRGQVDQVLMNLAVNARHAMPEGGELRIETSKVELGAADVAGRALAPGSYAQLLVSDTGSGMTSEVADRAFEPFFSTKPKGEGSGLGLPTVYGITTQAGGDVLISSEVGRGTTVRVLFPATSDAVTGPAEDQLRRLVKGRGETILLVEDEAMVREPAQRILSRNGYTVLTAAGGDEALAIVESLSTGIDLLLTDVVMPGRSGTELADSVAALLPEITVVFMSGYSEGAIIDHGDLEDCDLIAKPFSAAVLLRAVRTALDRREAIDCPP